MFETITESLNAVFRKLRSRGRLTEANINDGLREIRKALLEADVHFKVAKDFIQQVKQRALGQDVLKSVTPGQQIVKIVHDELIALMGPVDHKIPSRGRGPTILMLCGLQGSGKTTTAAKLALFLRRQGRKPMLVAADTQRPAAIDQLEILGKSIEIPVHADRSGTRPPQICLQALDAAEEAGSDALILDTAGRLHIDPAMMAEVSEIAQRLKPQQIYLVCDAMTGQDAVNSAKSFDEQLALDGVILTKLDGDARGGAALSVKAVTGKPIKFVATGEKLDGLEEFHPDRMANRILGMGDVVSLVEKAQAVVDEEQAKKLEQKIRKAKLNLDDFMAQLEQLERMGPMQEILSMVGLGAQTKDLEMDEKELPRIKAIIRSMTPRERRNPDLIDVSRRRRIAAGSGTEPADVNSLLKQFKQMKKMMKRMTKRGGKGAVQIPFG